jgi:hypothetical protein
MSYLEDWYGNKCLCKREKRSYFRTNVAQWDFFFSPWNLLHNLLFCWHIFRIFKYNQQDATLYNVFIYVKCSTCFRRVLRLSSGAQNCIHSIGYLPGLSATCGYCGRDGTGLGVLLEQHLPGLTATCGCRGWDGTGLGVLLEQHTQTSSNPSTTATGSSKAWQVPDVVYTVLSSRWWAEDPPETCRAFHRNKYIV